MLDVWSAIFQCEMLISKVLIYCNKGASFIELSDLIQKWLIDVHRRDKLGWWSGFFVNKDDVEVGRIKLCWRKVYTSTAQGTRSLILVIKKRDRRLPIRLDWFMYHQAVVGKVLLESKKPSIYCKVSIKSFVSTPLICGFYQYSDSL
jgi:hypothetical protein